MGSEPSSPAISNQYTGHVDNRCCFCLTLRTGAILTGVINGLVNIALFTAYVTSPHVKSSWGHPGEAVTNLDISYLVVFTLQIVCDAMVMGQCRDYCSFSANFYGFYSAYAVFRSPENN